MANGELQNKIGLAEMRLSEVRGAAQEGIENLETLSTRLTSEQGIDVKEIAESEDYLGGDSYELEQRLGRAIETIDSIRAELDEIVDPEPPHPADPSETPGR